MSLLVPCSTDFAGKQENAGHREATVNNAVIINVPNCVYMLNKSHVKNAYRLIFHYLGFK